MLTGMSYHFLDLNPSSWRALAWRYSGLVVIQKLGAAIWISVPSYLRYTNRRNAFMTLVGLQTCLDHRLAHLCKHWHEPKSIVQRIHPVHNTQLIKCLIETMTLNVPDKVNWGRYARDIMSLTTEYRVQCIITSTGRCFTEPKRLRKWVTNSLF